MDWTFTPIALEHMQRNGYGERDILGFIPDFLSDDDPRGAVEQIDDNYFEFAMSRWHDSAGWTLKLQPIRPGEFGMVATFPGDPPLHLLAETCLRDEHILFFNGAWVAVVQTDGSHRMARID